MSEQIGLKSKNIITDKSLENAMIVHAACGGSTNLLLHLPAIAHAANLKRMTVSDWKIINKNTPRLVDVLPNGPVGYPTSVLYAAGAVPEVMLQLREIGLLNTSVLTTTGLTLDENLDWWEESLRRFEVQNYLKNSIQVDPKDVIMTPNKAKSRGLTSTVTFPTGNLAPE